MKEKSKIKSLHKRRKELADMLSSVSNIDGPYFSVDWIYNNVLNGNTRIDEIKKILSKINAN